MAADPRPLRRRPEHPVLTRAATVTLAGPVVGWSVVDLPPDGSLDPVLGSDWTQPLQTAPACRLHSAEDVDRRGDPFLGGTALAPIVAAVHEPPMPFCVCGLGALYSFGIHRRFDRFRDRLGHRLRCLAIVELWGRVILESRGVRAQYGRVLALVVPADEPEMRRRRIETAAERVRARIVTVDPERFDAHEVLRREAPQGPELLAYARFARAARDRHARRWRVAERQRELARSAGFEGSAVALLAFGIAAVGKAAGLPASWAIVIAIVLTAIAAIAVLRREWQWSVSVEALAPAPPGSATPPARELPLTRGRNRVAPLAVLSELTRLWR